MNARRIVTVLLLVIPCIAVLLTPFYDRVEPRAFGIPFFYWYQLMWAPLSALALGLAIITRERSR